MPPRLRKPSVSIFLSDIWRLDDDIFLWSCLNSCLLDVSDVSLTFYGKFQVSNVEKMIKMIQAVTDF